MGQSTGPGLASPQPGLMSPSEQGRTSAASGGDWDDNGAQDGGFDNHDDDDEEYDEGDYEQEGGEGQDMEEDETIEEFEDRVLNKRAAQLHRLMTRKFAEKFSQMTVRNTRKQAAQKFHSTTFQTAQNLCHNIHTVTHIWGSKNRLKNQKRTQNITGINNIFVGVPNTIHSKWSVQKNTGIGGCRFSDLLFQ